MERPRGINILVTGTPGTGKTSMTALLAETLEDFSVLEVGKLIKENHWFTSYDEAFDTHIIEEEDEDLLLDHLETELVTKGGNNIVDYHSSELFPERWFHLVVVLKASTEILYDRLEKRGYKANKISENMEAEIQCICETEARESYAEAIILVRSNDTVEEMETTVELIAERVEGLRAERGLAN